MHRLLRRQLDRHGLGPDSLPAAWREFLADVDDAYEAADVDRRLVEHSLDVVSSEMSARTETLRSRADGALREAEERSQAIVDVLPDMLFVIDRAGVLLQVHAPAPQDLYEPEGDLVGRNVRDVLPTALSDRCLDLVERALTERAPQTWEYDLTFPTGVRRFEARVVPAGEHVTVALVRNVTETTVLRERLAVADRMASLGTLAAGVAHEVNNPLTYVLANLEHLQGELQRATAENRVLDPQEFALALREAVEGAQRVRDIVRDLQTFSRTELTTVGAVDVTVTIESSLKLAASEIRDRARIVRRYSDVPPVLGNAGRLGQVLVNLLANAAQALPVGHVAEHEIVVSTRVAEGGFVVIEVADTGPGIEPSIASRIFEPFFTTKSTGTGLGLAICHGIITGMDGEISVNSTPGAGTSVRIRLPAAPEWLRAKDSAPPSARDHDPARVLVIDDDPLVARAVSRLLRGHVVETAFGGRDGVARLLGEPSFDVVLCDLMMPDLSGMETYDAVVSQRPELASRFVFMTGGGFTPGAREFLERVANDRFDKPFDGRRLRAVVARHVVDRRLARRGAAERPTAAS